ncbi:MAG: cytochrome c biogenesis heme-transporting ATPase CcmA [Methylotenera sp.]|uniref:cytochrome c biogenesis heme-transporting ATPase CcmA n=1 Tax=Methylotenera sp. TaxID=2051956 RepID=UPI002489DB05|nr:cytochrome c biogenesis heme-transporting ATPase CcmA [Methylotenera sp.]MDI1310159.1 cytochrome c biogenesis heme-transporting ATPase CcmA [Methylotenera sp.]
MLTVQNLACLRGDRLLFKNVEFELNAGGLLYVLGENGSGKSSLLRMLCGLILPETGTVFWDKKTIKEETEGYLSNLTYIGHLNGLKDDLTALENLTMSARAAGNDVSEDKAFAALAAIGIERCANLPARVLSQGQKRRVTLAKLWLAKGKLWILDEPFAALDIASVSRLAAKLGEHLASGGMAILTTHQDVTIHAQSIQTLRLSE